MPIAELQKRCDGIAYPPTHTYDIESLEPTGVLAERAKLILGLDPDLFNTTSFLDVGCSKGWFALKAAQKAKRVLALDADARPIELLREIAPDNVDVRLCNFLDLKTNRVFKRVFLGNCLHHLYRSAGGWSFIDKLANFACGKVVIEAPTGMDCKDMETCIPPALQAGYNETAFMDAMSRYFKLEARCPSVAYSPDRHVMVFRCAGRADKSLTKETLEYADYLRYIYTKIKGLVLPTDTIAEVCCRHDRGVISREILPHKAFIRVDKNNERGSTVMDVRHAMTPECDVLISTAIMHHTPKSEWGAVLRNLTQRTKRAVFLTGPHEDVITELFGDHESHLDPDRITEIASEIGWKVDSMERVGLSYPLCELFVALGRA